VRFDVPLSSIAGARAVQRREMLRSARSGYDAKRQRLTAVFSDFGQVVITLDPPQPLSGRAAQVVASVLINLDMPEAFLDALASHARTSEARLQVAAHAGDDNLAAISALAQSVVRAISQGVGSAGKRPALQIEHLTRCYGSLAAVADLSLTVHAGEIYAFLGPNGAGKTTTMEVIAGLLAPTYGRVLVAGYDVWAEPLPAKAALGYAGDQAMLYERLTGREFLEFLAQLRGLPRSRAEPRIAYLLGVLGMAEQADRACGSYSLGMQRKTALAGALLHEPPVLVLDEPLNGLDPRSARQVKNMLAELAEAGLAVLLSTHDLATAEAVTQRAGIIHRGQLLAEGSAAELRALASAPDLETVFLTLTGEEARKVA
jgi:ABC-type multidrug transport system ATPase subunit